MSILVTRPSPAGEELVSRLRTLGQVAWHFPLIEFSPGRQLPQLADQLAALGESDLLFALSQHAVAFAQSQLHQQDRKWPRLPDLFRHWTHHRAGTTYRKRTEDSLPTGSGNQRSLATIT